MAVVALALYAAAVRANGADMALKHSDVVFMYASPDDVYRAYGATFVGWGGASSGEDVKRHHDLGIRCTGSMWCLTAGAKLIHENAEIRNACAVDIEGKPVEVPWLFDHTHEGTKSYFGCTNNPAFREHCRREVERCMKGGADGLHVDDHLGVASPAWYFGGGLCDYCIAAFREYLKENVPADELAKAGVADVNTFDYRDLIRKRAATREEYKKVQRQIPLMNHFLEFHAQAAAEHVKLLGEIAAKTAGHTVTLSANAGLPDKAHTYVIKYLTHIICEVGQNAHSGTVKIHHAIEAYELATKLGKPLAATASGWDWALVKEKKLETLPRFWIALAYAHGQRFMVPHPNNQWCFTDKLGTHWYQAPVEAFAPIYRFIRKNAECFDDFETASAEGVKVSEKVHVTVRKNERTGAPALHVLNLDYAAAEDRMLPAQNVAITLPEGLLPKDAKQAHILSYDAEPAAVELKRDAGSCAIILPELRLWSVIVVE